MKHRGALADDYLDGKRSAELTLAQDCATAGKALGEQGLATSVLTRPAGPCPAVPVTVPNPGAVAGGAVVELLERAKTCELAAEPGACQPLYDLIAQARRK